MKFNIMAETGGTLGGELVEILISTITSLFSGVGDGVITLFNTMVYSQETGLTALAQWGIVFMGVSLVLGIFTGILSKLF